MSKETLFIGIAAPTCAGKTSLLDRLQENLGPRMTVVNFDDYDRLYPGSKAIEEETAHPTIINWEDPKLFNYQKFLSDMRRLKNGLSISMLPYSRENDAKKSGVRTVIPSEFTVVEGIFVLHYPAARLLFDLKYYVDIPEDVMIERRLKRSIGSTNPCDQPEYITGPMLDGTRKFVVPQKQYADKVLDGTRPIPELAEQILVDFSNLQR